VKRIITAKEFLAVAKEQLGVTEAKDGTTKYGKWYGDRRNDKSFYAAPWCDMSLAWIAWETGRRKAGKEGAEQALKQTGEFAYTVWHAQWFAQHGRFGNTPRVGAFAFFDWQRSGIIGGIDHVGVVVGKTSDGRIITYEGNTSNAFLKRYRHPSYIYGYGYPFWLDEAYTNLKLVKDTSSSDTKFPLPKGHWFGVESPNPKNHSGAWAEDRPKVKRVQELLNKHGYKLAVDGIYGPKTRAAVIDFQKKNGLDADGLVGPITWNALVSKK